MPWSGAPSCAALPHSKADNTAGGDSTVDPIAHIEVPNSWLIIGIVPLAIASIALQYLAFSINPMVGLTTVILSFFLGIVACRATGETDVTPMSAMCKITQLTVAVLAPKNIVTNLMAASVTANIASSSADLLTDLKSGYLQGPIHANNLSPRWLVSFWTGCYRCQPGI
ncbi:MAG: OPT/YSL family transporter [Candidatus Obscuribacter sp.]|nr:OPT/YSL family transporter [Candidatus Obscuribacter sp.]